MITVRKYEEKDYETVAGWWTKRDWAVLPKTSLPTLGAVAQSDAEAIAAAWLYKTDSDIALIEWMVASPESTRMERTLAIPQIIDFLTQEANKMGYRVVFTWTNHRSLQERFTHAGFDVTDRDVQLLVKRVS